MNVQSTVKPARNAWSIGQICESYGINPATAYRAIAAGDLRAVKIGRKTAILDEDRLKWEGGLPAFSSQAVAA